MCFLVYVAKLLRTAILKNICEWLLEYLALDWRIKLELSKLLVSFFFCYYFKLFLIFKILYKGAYLQPCLKNR